MPIPDGKWRPEPHPTLDGHFIAARYVEDHPRPPKREVAQSPEDAAGRTKARAWIGKAFVEVWCDVMNEPEKPLPAGDLSESDTIWLTRLASAPEGVMERSNSRALNALEHRDLARSEPQPGYREMDRWHITQKGREALEQKGND